MRDALRAGTSRTRSAESAARPLTQTAVTGASVVKADMTENAAAVCIYRVRLRYTAVPFTETKAHTVAEYI